jgi:hypothetical protein
VTALEAITGEFGGFLGEDAIGDVVGRLSGNWMWIDDEHASATGGIVRDPQGALLARLDDLATAIRQLGPSQPTAGHGDVGHNMPPDGAPLTAEEQADALRTISEVRANVATGTKAAVKVAASAWSADASWWGELKSYGWKHVDLFLVETNKAVAAKSPYMLAALAAWVCRADIAHLLAAFLRQLV